MKTAVFEAALEAGFDPIPLHRWDSAKGSKKLGKAPRDDGWTTADYSHFDAAGHLAKGFNVGLRPRPGRIALDVDPRHGGGDSLYALELFFPELRDAPRTKTGGGGEHIFLSVPEGLPLSPLLKGNPGIEVKGFTRQVVAPGSKHPETGKLYRVAVPFNGPPPMAPEGLLSLLTLTPRERGEDVEPGKLSAEQLRDGLSLLDPAKFSEEARFFEVMAASHHATNGSADAMGVFCQWAAGDPEYADCIAENESRWLRMNLERGGGSLITYRTLLNLIAAAGPKGRRFVATCDRPDAAEDFADDPLEDDPEAPKGERIKGLSLTRASDIEEKPIFWLWPNHIALGKLTGLAGEPDQGKSQVTLAIAAAVTTGGAWPDDSGTAPLGEVLILSAEDDAEDTIKPRLMAAGADTSKVLILNMLVRMKGEQHTFSLADDLPRLREVLRLHPEIRLVVIDPVSAYMGTGKVDTFKNSDVRAVLAPLADLAGKAGVAVLFVTHFNKRENGSALSRVMDSLAFTALARSFWAVLPEREAGELTGRKLLLRVKQNIAASDAKGHAYRLEGFTLPGGINTSRVAWEEAISMTANEALAEQDGKHESPKLLDGITFLMSALKDGPVESSRLNDRGATVGLSLATLRRAKQHLHVHSYQEAGQWWCELPSLEEEEDY
ncbi:MAG TPA: AAA family ATPase [Devosia sp.]|nr:AAA family ATPase [Devosia sp.]